MRGISKNIDGMWGLGHKWIALFSNQSDCSKKGLKAHGARLNGMVRLTPKAASNEP